MPELDLPDWRETKAPVTPKSTGIPPRSFHGNRVRSRPGTEYVKELHEKSTENILREQKKDHIKAEQVKRSAFKSCTSLKTWPLQDLAMQDYEGLLKVYLNGKDSNNTGEEENVNDNAKPDHKHGDSSSSCASTDKKRAMKDKNFSPSKSQLKLKYLDGFTTERGIPPHIVATASCEPPHKFDPGLWSMEPRIFSVEKAKGKRKYLVGHLGRVMDYIWRKTDKCNRHFYELILEKTPCRLYFDLEYSIPENPGIDNEILLDEFYKELVSELILQFPDYMEGFDRNCVVNLDSSTPEKFSRHWIVHMPSQALFRDNQQVGKFVKGFIQNLADDASTGLLKDRCPCLQDHLFVNPKGTLKDGEGTIPELPLSKKTCFVDTGVYTRNRLFRLLGSSKWGKSPEFALRFAKGNQYPLPKGFGNDQFYVPAMIKTESSDSTDDDDDDLDQLEKENALAKFKAQTDWSLHAQVTTRTLVVPMNIPKIEHPLLPEIVDKAAENTKTIDRHFAGASSSNGKVKYRGSAYSSTRPSFGNSPYPYLDDFVLDELAGRGGVQGNIRAWTLDYGPDDTKRVPVGISFHMARNRWCEGIGRAHKSNNILWKVEFLTKQCIQSCFDPDCQAMNFRGTPIDLPLEVALQLDDALFEEAIATMDERELLGETQSNNNVVKKSTDDGEIEKAMMKLNLGGGQTEKVTQSAEGGEPSFDDALSDDALLDAINSNPDLFS